MSKNRNTTEKRYREMEKKRKADEKRKKRRERKEQVGDESPSPSSGEDGSEGR